MPPLKADQRAAAILVAIGAPALTRAASGRYQRSAPFRSGVRYWAASQPRLGQDFVGVQFFGEGMVMAAEVAPALEQVGFRQRTPQASQQTLAKAIPFAAGDELDVDALRAARSMIDRVLATPLPGVAEAGTPFLAAGGDVLKSQQAVQHTYTFLDRMAASPLGGLKLDDPDRSGDWRPLPF